ncbi:hypothetical protein K6U36_11625 [Vibrio alginolyticus]|uniref:AbiU2 domain-containing protein n=1 Tax=Vibrio alginolyticus TaxID=663 RepID=UPI001EEBE8D2|nr:hypothetical protein [Vibrio alginolyticus]MCG6332469.1 hypothetical protein [Vibrio alginolyticus]MCG6336823.1 hypothetical protein [Vibrio alginolyticus]
MITEEYTKYLKRLQAIVSMEVVPKTAMFDYFTSDIYKYGEDPQKVEPLVWYIQSALLSDLTFSIFRLFDDKADRNLYHFVRFSRENADKIEWKSPLTGDDFKEQQTLLKSIHDRKDTLRRRRNMYFAHYAEEYFFEPEKIQKELPFTSEDAKALVRVAQQIIGKHSYALSNSSAISIDGFVYAASDKLYEKLRSSYNETVA